MIIIKFRFTTLYFQQSCPGGEIQEDTKETTAVTFCGHKPYTQVTCTLVASNNAGNSSGESVIATTFCGGKTV